MLIAAQGDFTESYREINYGDRSSNRLRNAREHMLPMSNLTAMSE